MLCSRCVACSPCQQVSKVACTLPGQHTDWARPACVIFVRSGRPVATKFSVKIWVNCFLTPCSLVITGILEKPAAIMFSVRPVQQQ